MPTSPLRIPVTKTEISNFFLKQMWLRNKNKTFQYKFFFSGQNFKTKGAEMKEDQGFRD